MAGGEVARRNGAGQFGDDQTFGAVGNAGKRQRPAELWPLPPETRPAISLAPSPFLLGAARESPLSCRSTVVS